MGWELIFLRNRSAQKVYRITGNSFLVSHHAQEDFCPRDISPENKPDQPPVFDDDFTITLTGFPGKKVNTGLLFIIRVAGGQDPQAEKITNSTKANEMLTRNYRAPWKLPGMEG